MQPMDLATIRKHLERAADDIDYFLGADNKRENAREEAGKRYELLDEGWTPPKGKGRGKLRLTKTQYNALVHRTTVNGNPLTDEKREAILADLDLEHVEVPTSDAGREAFAFWARGGWRESSRQAAVWLRKAERNVAADGIDEALRPLFKQPRDAAEESDYREDMRTAAEYVRTILTTCPEDSTPDPPSKPKGKPGPKGPSPEQIEQWQELEHDWLKYCEYCKRQDPPKRPRQNDEWQCWRCDAKNRCESDPGLTLEEAKQWRKDFTYHLKRNPNDAVSLGNSGDAV